METAYLREYIVFSESMSFARAAKDLFVSPPTLRTHIKQLEAEVGDALLVKHGEKIEFTPVGKPVSQTCSRNHEDERIGP